MTKDPDEGIQIPTGSKKLLCNLKKLLLHLSEHKIKVVLFCCSTDLSQSYQICLFIIFRSVLNNMVFIESSELNYIRHSRNLRLFSWCHFIKGGTPIMLTRIVEVGWRANGDYEVCPDLLSRQLQPWLDRGTYWTAFKGTGNLTKDIKIS